MQHQHDYAVIEKQIGETPLAALARLRRERGIPEEVPLTYAGRLDPLATGKLLVLIGRACKNAHRYRALDKEYTLRVLVGVSSDTGDLLGIPILHEPRVLAHTNSEILATLRTLEGTHTVPYPAYSSKTVGGIPLWKHALTGTLSSITVPTTTSTYYRIRLLGHETFDTSTLSSFVTERLASVIPSSMYRGVGDDFRLPAVCTAWKSLCESLPPNAICSVLTLSVTCSTGTYMRTLADTVAVALGAHGLALSIERTIIGRYFASLWLSRYGFWYGKY